MPTSKPLRMEDYAGPQPLPGCWWYVQAGDTNAAIAIKNPHLEADGDEDGIWYDPSYDALRILENGEWRELTDEESDEYTDDVYAWLRACDWSN